MIKVTRVLQTRSILRGVRSVLRQKKQEYTIDNYRTLLIKRDFARHRAMIECG